MITKEEIKKEIIEYFELHLGAIDIQEDEMLMSYDIDDFDLVELELHLEQKFNFTPKEETQDGAQTNDNNTLIEIVNLLYFYLNK